jgi:phosphonate transport system substrate-binding protein
MKQMCSVRSASLVIAVALLAFSGCSPKAQSDYAPKYESHSQTGATNIEYVFGILPLQSTVELSKVYQPVVDAINRQATGFTVRMETARDYPAYEAKLRERKLDLALMNSFQALAAEKLGYRIFGKIGGDELVYGIIIVRKDSGIRNVNDLRGKTISFPSPSAIVATMLPKFVLMKAGLNVDQDAKPIYVGSIDSVVMNVYSGLSAAGGLYPATWEAMKKQHPEIVDALEIKWRSAPFLNSPLAVRDDLPKDHLNAIAKVLFDLDKTEQGRVILSRIVDVPRIEPANSQTYDPARKFLKEYERLFGKLPTM